jgi:hypothetical protein
MFFSNTTLAGAFIVGVGALLMVLALPGAIVAVLAGVALAIGLVLLNAGLTADKIRSERPVPPSADQPPTWAANVTSEIRHALEASQHEGLRGTTTSRPDGGGAGTSRPPAGARPGGLPDLPAMPPAAPIPAGSVGGRPGESARPGDVPRPPQRSGLPPAAAGPALGAPTSPAAAPMSPAGGYPPGAPMSPAGGYPPAAPMSPAGGYPPAGSPFPPASPPPRDGGPGRPAVYGSPASPTPGLYGTPAAPDADDRFDRLGRGSDGPMFEAPPSPPVAPLAPMSTGQADYGADREINPLEDTAVTMPPIRDPDSAPSPRLHLLDDDTSASISHDHWSDRGGSDDWPGGADWSSSGSRASVDDSPPRSALDDLPFRSAQDDLTGRPPLDDLPSRPPAPDGTPQRRPLFDIPPAAMAALDALEAADKEPGSPRRGSLFDIPDKQD